MTETTDATDASAQTVPQDDVLTPADIQNAVRIIDFACDQGAFKGWEVIQKVLLVRNRLNNFLLAVMPPQEEAATDAAPTT